MKSASHSAKAQSATNLNARRIKAYAAAGVDVDLGNRVKGGIQPLVASTHGPNVLGKIGGFGGLFRADFGKMREPVLVSSIDGVGTKLKIAFQTGRHETIGRDLVNHCINDIAVIGARPLFFLDYIGAGRLQPAVFTQILKGLAKACREGGCAFIGGETAQMPGIYQTDEYDLVGCIVGVVEKKDMLDGSNLRAGDVVLGLPSNGLHTNGYSLARKVLLETMGLRLEDPLPGTKRTVASELLRVHKNYEPALSAFRKSAAGKGAIKAAAHITGGGLVDNPPRVLPPHLDAVIETRTWTPPPIFRLIQEGGKVDPEEMYQVFNMGIGMVIFVSEKSAPAAAKALGARIIGRVVPGCGKSRIIL
jgi:phosphoribosylformylglycinamidine cyclo-ligase